MAVVIETTLGDITVDLYLEQRPVTCLNFLKLCKMKYYNFNLFHSIRSGFIAQTGDPTGEGSGGQSIWGLLEGPNKRFFSGEKMPKIRHHDAGLLSMVCTDDMMVGSQFFFTLAPDLDSLDGVHCVIGEVTEGREILSKLNDVICDETHRPYQDVRITHTVVLEDPFSDPPGLRAPSRSPSPSAERLKGGRIAPDEEIDETQGKSAEEIQEMVEEKEAKARATILEIVGDLPDADIAPPENVLFVCKLNPVTTDEDLEIIFSRFGKIVSCEVIRDKKTGDSLQYAFIEFADKQSCEDAYFKMDNVLIDDRRIHVDFSQSVSKMRWLGKGRGVKYLEGDETKNIHLSKDKSETSGSKENQFKRQSNSNRYDKSEARHDREDQHKHANKTSFRGHKDRSRSRSHIKKYDKSRREKSPYDHKNSRKTRKEQDYFNKNTASDDDNRKKDRNSHSTCNKRNSSRSPLSKVSNRRKDKEQQKTKSIDNRSCDTIKENDSKDAEKRGQKRKQSNREMEPCKNHKKASYNQNHIEPKTPSPVIERKEKYERQTDTHQKDLKKKVTTKNNDKKKRIVKTKKRRKPSTSSSDSDSSSSSSSSSSTSSSSDSDIKKKKVRRKKTKQSSSSSSSSESSSSSSTSSDSSSDSSSSSSDSYRSKKKRKQKLRKNI